MRNMVADSITKNPLYFVCFGEPDKGQEDFDCCCCRPNNAFLCEKKHLGSHRENVLNTYYKALPRLAYIIKCGGFAQHAWRGNSCPKTAMTYMSTIIADIAV